MKENLTRVWKDHIFKAPSMPFALKNRPVRFLLRFVGWAIVALLPVYCLVMTELIHCSGIAPLRHFLQTRPLVVDFDLGLMYLLWICVLCLVRRGWAATLIYSGVFGLAAYVNYLKYAMTGDYFYPWDLIQQAGNFGELTRFITVPFPPQYLFLILFGLALAVPVWLSGAAVPLRWKVRLPLLAVVVAMMVSSVSSTAKITALLNRHGMYLEHTGIQSNNYYENGFIGAFSINVLSSNIPKPEGYSQEAVEQILAPYEAQPAAEDFSNPDIILILSESFWDPTKLAGTEFSEDPLDGYRALCREDGVISGRFFTTGFGGGTVRPEFEIISGMSSDHLPSGSVPWQYVTQPTESYVSIYDDLGYDTVAIHPYTSSFYSRKDTYPIVGFDELCFNEEIWALSDKFPVTVSGGQISDDTFARTIEYYLDETGSDAPKFIFGISMENHQPYPDKYDAHRITVKNDALDDDVLNAVTNFTEGVSKADDCLVRLVDYIRGREKETILVWFGDHLPTLGSNLGAYVQTGVNDLDRQSYYEYLYSTPFIVVANFELNEGGMLHAGTDNDIATYNLMNAVSQLIGAPRTQYMEFLEGYFEAIPYSNTRLNQTLTETQQAFVDAHRMLTYDRLAGGRYSLD